MARLLLVCLLCVAFTAFTASTVVDLQRRVMGGQTCGPNERLYHVKLSMHPSGFPLLCGGSLISDRWILTAAHCRTPALYAVLGVHPGPGKIVQITEPPVIFTDKDVLKNTRIHDIMLLKLPSSTNIDPVDFDCTNPPKIGDTVQSAGHATRVVGPNNKIQSDETNTLQCGNIQVVDCQEIRKTLLDSDPRLYSYGRYEHWFCGKTPGVYLCKGDSGGGVVYQNKIYGVNSFKGADDGGDVCNELTGFIDICHEPYFKWITNTIAPKKCFGCG